MRSGSSSQVDSGVSGVSGGSCRSESFAGQRMLSCLGRSLPMRCREALNPSFAPTSIPTPPMLAGAMRSTP
jgi:hypothetical protein